MFDWLILCFVVVPFVVILARMWLRNDPLYPASRTELDCPHPPAPLRQPSTMNCVLPAKVKVPPKPRNSSPGSP